MDFTNEVLLQNKDKIDRYNNQEDEQKVDYMNMTQSIHSQMGSIKQDVKKHLYTISKCF